MATYKVWLTVKDSYGNTKEVDGGTINVDLATLTPDEVTQIENIIPLDEYIRRDNLDVELDAWATDKELEEAIKNSESLRYTDFELSDFDFADEDDGTDFKLKPEE